MLAGGAPWVRGAARLVWPSAGVWAADEFTERRNHALRLHAEGHEVPALASIVGRSASTMYRWIIEARATVHHEAQSSSSPVSPVSGQPLAPARA